MADNTLKGGFRFRRMRNGADRPVVELRTVATGYATGIYKGDPLTVQADGSVVVSNATAAVDAVADGVEQYWDGQVIRKGTYLPGATAWGTVRERRSVVRCILSRDAIFEADASGTFASEGAWEAHINSNVDSATGAGGSTATGQSSYLIDISGTGTATTAAQWRIVGLSTLNQDYTGNYVKVLVEANESTEPQYLTTGV